MKNSIVIILLTLISFNVKAQSDTIKIQTTAQCGDCKAAIEKQLNFEKGVKSAFLDTDSKIVTVIYNSSKTDPDKLRKSISIIGYDADSIPADPKAYKRLKPCCSKDGHKGH